MKRLAILLITVLTLVSCGDEVEFSTPGVQGTKNYVVWRAEYSNAAIDGNGFLTITAGNNAEILELRIPSVAVGTYVLGDVDAMEARFTNADGTVFSTNNRPDPTVSIYPEYGFIKLDEIINNTFSGRFEFNAYDQSGMNVVNFGGVTEQNPNDPGDTGEDPIGGGIFYRVPLTSGSFPSTVITCADAEDDIALAQAGYNATTSSDLLYINSDDYIAACGAYLAALEAQRTYCGDLDGTILDIINSLNECEFPCELATQNRITAQATLEEATIANYLSACADYQFYLEQQIAFCGDEDGSIQATLDDLDCGDNDNDGIPNVFENFNGDVDGNLDDDDSDGDGIANYLDDDDDGDGILTIDEAKDDIGNPIDSDGDGDVDYLDNDDDGDGLFSNFETGDTTGNGVPDYLSPDDDGDGLLTINENADPNLDGDPVDALDSDLDGIPDYLDNM